MTENNIPRRPSENDRNKDADADAPATSAPSADQTRYGQTRPDQQKPRRRGLLIGAAAVAALLIAGGVGFAVGENVGDDDDDDGLPAAVVLDGQSAATDSSDVRDSTDPGADDSDAGDSGTVGSASDDGRAPVSATADAASFRDAISRAVAETGARGASSVSVTGDRYEVDTELEDGTSVEVIVSGSRTVVAETDRPDRGERPDPVIDTAALDPVMDAASGAARRSGGAVTVESVSASDDRGVAYEVGLRGSDGREIDVDLASDNSVVAVDADD